MPPSKSQQFAAFVTRVRQTAPPCLVIGAQLEDELLFLGHDATDVAAILGRTAGTVGNREALVCPLSDLCAIEEALADKGTPFVFARYELAHGFRVFRSVLCDVNESFDDTLPERIPDPVGAHDCELMFAWEGRRECYRSEIAGSITLLEKLLAAGGRRFLGTRICPEGGQPVVLCAAATRALAGGAEIRSLEAVPFMPPQQTPWGYAHSFRRVGEEGIAWVDTPDHGGLYLPARFAEEVAAALHRYAPQWFEEDVLWSVAVAVLARHFPDEELFRANEVQASRFGDEAVRAYLAGPLAREFRQRLAAFGEKVRSCWRVTRWQPASSSPRDRLWKLDFRHMTTGEERSVVTANVPKTSFVTDIDFKALGASISLENQIHTRPAPAALAIA